MCNYFCYFHLELPPRRHIYAYAVEAENIPNKVVEKMTTLAKNIMSSNSVVGSKP